MSPEGCLGVGMSVMGKRWQLTPACERTAAGLAQAFDLPDLVGRLLSSRGVGMAEAPGYLTPKLRDDLPDPARLIDMDRAASRLADAAEAGERVCVFGDYDVDGATSSALLIRYFRALGREIDAYIPDRLTEGYGPNGPALRRLASTGIRLVVTVDCGILAFDALAEARDAGLDVVVVDHHKAEKTLPTAAAVVDPNRLDDLSGCGQMAAVGVTFLLAVATNRELRRRDWFGPDRPEPDLRSLLDLVALGTVCDVVPLTGANRTLVTAGTSVVNRWANPGLAALREVAGLTEAADAYHLGFVLGPRINAGGRVGKADLGTRLLATDDPREALSIALALDGLNKERRQIEAEILEGALAEARAMIDADPRLPVLVVEGRGWHPGVIGIVASRLKERFDRPAVVIGDDGAPGAIGKGSGRSVRGIDLGAAVIAAKNAGLLEAGGGHAMAAGLTVAWDKLPDLRAFLIEALTPGWKEKDPMPVLDIAGLCSLRGANLDLCGALDRVGPWGAGNPEPVLALPDVRVLRADPVGENHLRCVLADDTGASLKAIAFRALDTPLGQALRAAAGAGPAVRLHVAGKLRLDRWNRRTDTQLLIEDLAYSK